MAITTSLITPTYNWPEALELLLLSAFNQSVLPNEIIIADDGSTSDTAQLIKSLQKKSPVPLIHIWHEDEGNQKPKIMNKAIASAKYDYVIEIDGDIIMHKDFVKDHISNARQGLYLFGSRVNIKKEFLPKLFNNKITNFNILSSGINKKTRALRIPILASFYKPTEQRSKKLRGCNMSFWKKDFIAVNGFNEDLVGWGIDDSEMIQRLHNLGIKGKRLRYKGIVYHIYHNEQSKSHIHLNRIIEEKALKDKLTWCQNGINKYLK